MTPQKAQEALRARHPSIVRKSARGEYAVDDAAMQRLFADRRSPAHRASSTRYDGSARRVTEDVSARLRMHGAGYSS